MRSRIRGLAPLFAAAVAVFASVAPTPEAAAQPECTQTGPNTTQCQTRGSTQIVTTPPVIDYPWYGWPYGGIVIGFGL